MSFPNSFSRRQNSIDKVNPLDASNVHKYYNTNEDWDDLDLESFFNEIPPPPNDFFENALYNDSQEFGEYIPQQQPMVMPERPPNIQFTAPKTQFTAPKTQFTAPKNSLVPVSSLGKFLNTFTTMFLQHLLMLLLGLQLQDTPRYSSTAISMPSSRLVIATL
jgi:hypothetical protein